MSMSTLECAPHSSLSSNATTAASSSSALNSFSISCSSSSFDDVLSPHSSSLPSLSPPLSANNNNNNNLSNYYLDYQSPHSYQHHNQISNQTSTSNLQHDETLGSCELNSDPLWPKMNAVVGGSAAKKRKKPDVKPQSQIAKCLNEKRRREQENNYIEELAELISAASFAESMSSLAVKPDKCAILQETVNQIRNIKQQETSSDAVQQGEVSSSKPTVITNEVLGPLLLEVLEGFLFVVNADGYVDFCTENIRQFIRYTRQEVLGQSVYNLIHHGDHARFHNCLAPSSHPAAWGPDSSGAGGKRPSVSGNNRTFNIRLLVKPPDDTEETMEEKQQRVYKYENMQISSTHLSSGLSSRSGDSQDDSGEVSSESGPCLMCVARRIPPNDKTLSSPIEQFTMKLERNGTIIGMDTSGVSQVHAQYLNKDLKGRRVQDLCHSQDLPKFAAHLSSTLTQGTSNLALYRLRVSPDRFLHVQTKSKLFRANSNGEVDFVMATHSIINDNDVALVMETAQHQQQQQQLLHRQQPPALTTTSSSSSSSLSSSLELSSLSFLFSPSSSFFGPSLFYFS
uniref:Nuclear receptor coactivator 2 n=1 Tax=Cacopsylla melanoneura TaxID=428564 RepID=A0A8D8R172_9HEMI